MQLHASLTNVLYTLNYPIKMLSLFYSSFCAKTIALNYYKRKFIKISYEDISDLRGI